MQQIDYARYAEKLKETQLRCFNDYINFLISQEIEHEVSWNAHLGCKGGVEVYLPPSRPGELGVTREFLAYL